MKKPWVIANQMLADLPKKCTASQYMTPAELDAAFPARHRAGRSAGELWAEERVQLLPAPATSFEVRKPIPVETTRAFGCSTKWLSKSGDVQAEWAEQAHVCSTTARHSADYSGDRLAHRDLPRHGLHDLLLSNEM